MNHLLIVALATGVLLVIADGAKLEGTIQIGYIAESAEDERDGVDHLGGYFRYLYKESGDPLPRRVNVTTFRLDLVEKDRSWLKLSQNLASFTALSPAMIIGPYRREIDQFLPEHITYIVTGRKAVINNLDLKHSTEDQSICVENDVGGHVISLLPPLNTFLTPLQQYLLQACWPENVIVIIMESEDDLLHFNSGLSPPGPVNIHLRRLVIKKDLDYWDMLDKLVVVQKLGTPHIIIHSNDLEYIYLIIDTAKELNMVTYLYRWYLTYPDIEGIDDELSTFFIGQYSNVTGHQLVDNAMLGQAMPLKGNGLNHAIMYDAMKILVKSLKPGQNETPTIDDFFETAKNDFTGSLGSYGKVSIVNPFTKERHFCRLQSSYDWMAFEGGEFSKIGSYSNDIRKKSPRTHINPFSSIHVWSGGFRRRIRLRPANMTYKAAPKAMMPIFNSMPISVVAVDDPPLVTMKADGTYAGVMVDYLKEYARKLNFTYEITKLVRHAEGAGGQRYADISKTVWTGAVRDILQLDAVLAIGAIGTTIQREVVMDFSETTMPGVISLMAKKRTIAYDTWQFLSPFTWKMWLGIGAVLVVISIIVTFLDLLDRSTQDFKDFPVRDSFYYTASILFFASTDQRPNSAPMRVLIGFFAFFAIVVTQSYVANMAAFLTTRRDESLPMTIDALSRQSAVPFGLMANGEAMALLKRATKGPYLYLMNKFDSGNSQDKTNLALSRGNNDLNGEIFFSYEDAMAAIKNGSFIFISENPITRYFVHNDCDLIAKDQETDAIRYAIGMPKGALFRRELDRVIGEVREEVAREVEIMDTWYAELPCAKGGKDTQITMKTRSLLWEEMQGLFITLGIGAGLAVFTAFVGAIHTRAKRSNPRQKARDDGPIADELSDVMQPPESCGESDGVGPQKRGVASPETSARARPLQMTPMTRPRSQDESDEP